MGTSWFKYDNELHAEPKVRYMASILDVDVDTLCGRLGRLWGWADRTTTDGYLEFSTVTTLDADFGPGFTDAMLAVGWLEAKERGFQIHNFSENHGETARKRYQNAKRQARSRGGSHTNVTPMSHQCHTNVTQTAPPRKEKSKSTKARTTSTISSGPSGGGKPGFASEFLEFWEAYPRKAGKDAASSRWDAVVGKEVSEGQKRKDVVGAILAAVKAFAISDRGKGPYCPEPANWLRDGHWRDDPAAWCDKTQTGKAETSGNRYSKWQGDGVPLGAKHPDAEKILAKKRGESNG